MGSLLFVFVLFLISQAFLAQTLECSDSSAACWEIEFLPLIPSRDLNVFFFKEGNECEVISAEIIFVLTLGVGGHCTELAHKISLKKKQNSSVLQKEEKK